MSNGAGIGLFNIIYWQPSILKAFSPSFLFAFLVRNGRAGWEKLGGVVLCITGAFPCPTPCFAVDILGQSVQSQGRHPAVWHLLVCA